MKSWLLETFPAAMHYAPRDLRLNLVRRHLGPSGAWWLRDRVEGWPATVTGMPCSPRQRAATRVPP
jgi:hypothetical protein